MIKEEVEGGTENTESLAYLVSFTAAYHLEDLARLPADDEVVDQHLLFGKLEQLSFEWPRADHAVQEHVLEQLVAYRDSLDPAHRERPARSSSASTTAATRRPSTACSGARCARSLLKNSGTPAAAHPRRLAPPAMLTWQSHASRSRPPRGIPAAPHQG